MGYNMSCPHLRSNNLNFNLLNVQPALIIIRIVQSL